MMKPRERFRFEVLASPGAWSYARPAPFTIAGSLGVTYLVIFPSIEQLRSFDAPRYRNVYFLFAEESNLIKIGSTKDVERRFCQIQCGSPEKLWIITALCALPCFEDFLHRRFAHDRVRGEWFRPSDDLADFILKLVPDEERAGT